MKKQPLLQVMVSRYPDTSRKELYALILCGEVLVAGERIKDPKTAIPADATIVVSKKLFVSRGGIKLDHAMDILHYDVSGMTVLDVGASTGGFTDCLLQRGASHVHAVDVGTNQLSYSLRIDPRVTVHENTNIMDSGPFTPRPSMATADISFRSIRGAASVILDSCLDAVALVLVKPQFEVQGSIKGFDGVIRDHADIERVLREVVNDLSNEGVFVYRVIASPIRGRKGNQEFFFHIGRDRRRTSADTILAQIQNEIEGYS